ncbi:DUF1294 domain-containing protein [Alkalibacillus haloalkaliphilus]|uniref:DUF1294 domain-containing protein n=1 Tax=Alkalibacillus haloalkaliphilus TaxID=94136 RepID=UPI00037D8586|nr:DUF1294 domain-containing protein [Alkalibacillus haloalkaliphilus]
MEIFLYVLVGVASMIAFIMMGLDKSYARKGKWRIPERTLWVTALIGGAPGAWFGMIYFRHKTKHSLFQFGMPLLTITWMIILL